MEDGKTKSQVAAKYGIPKNTLSTWLKNKDNIFKATKKESNSKRQQLRQVTFANLDQAMFKWLLVIRSRDAADSAIVFKTKAFEFAEKMNVENFKESDGWLDRWKKQFNVSFKTVSGESNACTDEIGTPWEQATLPTIFSSTRSTTPSDLACFIALNQISPYIWRMKIALVVNTANCVWQGWQQLMQLAKNYPCFWSASLRNLDVSNI